MKAIFSAPVANANAVLPPMDVLHYHPNGELEGGYSMIGQIPIDGVPTAMVQIHSSEATVQAMCDDPAYLWLANVVEVDEDGEPIDPPDVGTDFDRALVRQWARDNGYNVGVVMRCIPNLPPQASDTAKLIIAGFLELQQVTLEEYVRAGGDLG